MSATVFRTRLPRRDSTASRATLTMADQCVASTSNFAVGIVVARISGPSGLGAFALAYTVWVLLATLHRSLITDPMAIMGDMRGDEKAEFVRRGFAADITLGLMAACIIAAVGSALLVVGQDTFGVGLLSVAPWVVVLDLQDYWRWIGFMQGQPKKSLMNDLVFNAVQAVGVRVGFPGRPAFGLRRCRRLGLRSGDLRTLWSPSVLGAPRDSRWGGLSLVSLAHESVVGQRACRQLGGESALSHSCGCHFGSRRTRRFEGCAGTCCRPDDGGDQRQRKLRLARGNQAIRRPRLDWNAQGVTIRHRCGSCGVTRLWSCCLCGGAHALEAALRPRVRAIRSMRSAVCRLRCACRPRCWADYHLDRHAPRAATLCSPAREVGFWRRSREHLGLCLRGHRRRHSVRAERRPRSRRHHDVAILDSPVHGGSTSSVRHRSCSEQAGEKHQVSSRPVATISDRAIAE